MSKSKGNFFKLEDLLERGASPAAVRLELIKTHYRSNSNFTFQGLKDAQRQIDRWARLHDWLRSRSGGPAHGEGPLEAALPAFREALRNDLNVAGAIGVLNEAAGAYRLEGDETPDYHACSPLHFVPHLAEDGHLERLRERFVLLGHGQGRWENPEQSWRTADVLGARGIPNRVDAWGPEWDHDWVTWRKMLPQYLDELLP